MRCTVWIDFEALGAGHAGSRFIQQEQTGLIGERDCELELFLITMRERACSAPTLAAEPDDLDQPFAFRNIGARRRAEHIEQPPAI